MKVNVDMNICEQCPYRHNTFAVKMSNGEYAPLGNTKNGCDYKHMCERIVDLFLKKLKDQGAL